MRPLNRPMFRYGGPIKEGVMSGIREPKKNGGPTGTGLVGDQRYPKTNGREHHAIFIPPAIAAGAGLNALRMGAMRLAPRAIQGVKNFFRTQTGTKTIPKPGPTFTMPGKTMSSKGYTGTVPGKTIGTGTMEAPIYGPSYLGRDPTVRLVGGAYKAVTNPKVSGMAGKAARVVFSPTGIATGLYFSNGKFFNKDNIEVPPPPNAEKLILGDEVDTSGASGSKGAGSGVELTAAERRAKNVERYRDIMDIKGMNKKAAYNSLIDASRLINESGDFKGDIKSGKLINQIIGAASKQFDKPAQTKDAIDTLILKGEIEKDLNKEKNALDNEYKRSAIALNEAKIAQDSLMGDRKSYLEKNKALPSGQMLAGLARNRGYQVAGIEDVTEVKNWMKENGKDEVEYLKDVMTRTEIAPGIYVINTRLIQVTEDNKLQEI